MTKDFYDTNEKRWNELAELHYKSKGYRVNEFLDGMSSLHLLELEEIGSVQGKELLHLQCHFGLDTLSWAREGAKVTGIDFTENAIRIAKELSQETQTPATFVHSNVYELPDKLTRFEEFDIVFTSYGTIVWLHDLQTWAKLIYKYLKPGGMFYIIDGHPFATMLDYEKGRLQFAYPYFYDKQPTIFEEQYSYVDIEQPLQNTTIYEWNHPLSQIITSLIKAGLTIEFLHEFPFAEFKRFSFLKEGEDNYWHYEPSYDGIRLPLMYSIKARKDE